MEITLYKELKARKSVSYRIEQWETNLLDIITAMFSYEGLPETVHPEFIELYLNLYGSCAIWETKDGYAVTYCNRAGSPNVNGLGKDLICTTFNGETKTFYDFETSPDVVFIRNDKYENPDPNYESIAELLGHTDKSLKHIIINARYTPIPIARDNSEKMAIEGVLNVNNDSEGKPQAIVSENVLSDLMDGGSREMRVLNLTDVTASDKIQYIHKSKDDTLRQFFNIYGMDTYGSGKMAQQSVAEINSGCNSTMIIPHIRLEERKKAMEKCALLFGWDCSVDFSKCWKREEQEREIQTEEEIQEPATEVTPEDQEMEGINNEESLQS